MPSRLLSRALVLAAVVAAPSISAQTTSMLEPAFPGISFSEPLELAEPVEGRIYVAQKEGRIRSFDDADLGAGATLSLDLRSLINDSGERGLLGMAFHPDFAQNGYVFVHYSSTSGGRTTVARYTRSATDPAVFDPASALVFLTANQPFANHNGGKLAFGPDGFLYLSLGDGGSSGDPGNRSQDRTTLLGKLLRIDIDNPAPPLNYSVPADNPFVGNTDGFREEIYAYGLRNMFKFSFDRETGRLWGADVGQNAFEEVNEITLGGNYGWRIREGANCYNPSTNCQTAGLIDPVYQYAHPPGGGRSVTGGLVYRGARTPDLVGEYLFADYIVGDVWALDLSASPVTRRTVAPAGFGLIAFAEDAEGEVYILNQGGSILRFVSTPVSGEAAAPAEAPALRLASANPFTGRTTIELTPAASGDARVTLTDVLGRRVAVLHDGAVTAGERRRLVVNGSGLAPGVYLVRLDADGATSFLRIVRAQ